MIIIFTRSSGNWPFFFSFRSSAAAIYQWPVPLPPCGVLLTTQLQSRQHPCQGWNVTYHLNIDGAPIDSRSRTHPSHSQTSRLLNQRKTPMGRRQFPHAPFCIKFTCAEFLHFSSDATTSNKFDYIRLPFLQPPTCIHWISINRSIEYKKINKHWKYMEDRHTESTWTGAAYQMERIILLYEVSRWRKDRTMIKFS